MGLLHKPKDLRGIHFEKLYGHAVVVQVQTPAVGPTAGACSPPRLSFISS